MTEKNNETESVKIMKLFSKQQMKLLEIKEQN